MAEPTTKLYFVKKPTMSSGEFGREPRIGVMKTVKGRPRKIKEVAGDEEIISNQGKLNKMIKSERVRRKAQIGSQAKLEAVAKRARQRAEKLFKPVELEPFAEQAREKIRAKTFASQAQARAETEKAKDEALARSAENSAQREAILALPQLMRQQTLRISALQPPLQANLMALQRVAPDVAEQLKLSLVPEKEGEAIKNLFEPQIEEPSEKEAVKSRDEVKAREIVRKVIEEEGLTSKQKVATRVKQLLGTTRMPKGVNGMIDEKLGKKGKGKGLDFQQTTTAGAGRKGIGGGLFSSIKNLAKSAVSKAIDVVKDDPIGSAKKAFEVAKQAREQYHKLTGKGGALPARHKKAFMDALNEHKDKLKGAGLFDDIKNGFVTGFKMPFQLLGLGGGLTEPKGDTTHAQGGGFFSSLKDLGKKAISKVAEKVMEDPIGSAKKAFELGQQGREQYAKMFGKKEKGGKMFIPKKHIRVLYKHAKQAHGKGFADMFMNGLMGGPLKPVMGIMSHIL